MKILSNSARIEGNHTNNNKYPLMDTVQMLMGYGIGVRFYPDFDLGFFVLARQQSDKNALCLIGVPTEEWINDLRGEGWEIIQILSSRPTTAGEGKEI